MAHNGILLDTSFFIRLLNEQDALHENTLNYYKYFLNNDFPLICSTISIAEYCVKGKIDELPFKDLQILPFDINHAVRAGALAKIVYEQKDLIKLAQRLLIPNDTKLFAQADIEVELKYFATSDLECIKIYNLLKAHTNVNFEIINIREVYKEIFK